VEPHPYLRYRRPQKYQLERLGVLSPVLAQAILLTAPQLVVEGLAVMLLATIVAAVARGATLVTGVMALAGALVRVALVGVAVSLAPVAQGEVVAGAV
jgi:hypothetical protein